MKEKEKPAKADMLKWTDAYRRCLVWFFDYPYTEISLNELSEKLKMSKTAVRTAVLSLAAEGFLTRKELGRVWRISCNKEHPFNQGIKIFTHIKMLLLADILEKVYKKVPNARNIILFGSYRKGDDTEKSDVDIAVEVAGSSPLEIVELGEIDIGYRKNVKINLHIFTRNKIDINLFANIANGIVLDGFLEAKPK